MSRKSWDEVKELLPSNKEHKLQVPYWEVVGYDKYEYQTFVMKYKNKPDALEWVLKYFNPATQDLTTPPWNVFDYDEKNDDWYNRVGDSLKEMIENYSESNGWSVHILNDGQSCDGLDADCRLVTHHVWND